ncbi:hypothetical protein BDY19DRAFT_892966, partial [Irpex rosettiformis]
IKYGDSALEAPPDALRELTGLSNSINHGYGGKFVWLVPEYTTDSSSAANSFSITIQSIADLAFDDLAKGAGGDFRYLQPKLDTKMRVKITEVQLLRSDAHVKTPPVGWHGISNDINFGRQRTHLYVIWKSS